VEKDHLQDGPFYIQQTHPQADDRDALFCHTRTNKRDFGLRLEIVDLFLEITGKTPYPIK
jgi:hypothetical protein